jgi:hypothetical protein
MKVSTLLIGMTILAIAAAPAAAQQKSLGDVAGSIKLKRPEGESIVIDQNSVGRTRRAPSGVTEENFLAATIEDCLTETRSMQSLLLEARSGEAFYREEWRERVEELGFDLQSALEDLRMARVDGRMQQALDLANEGADTAGNAYEILSSAVAQNRPVFSEARKMSEDAIRTFEDAKKAMGAAARANAAEDYALPINPIEANEVMTSLCRGRFADGSSGFNQCMTEQRAAVDAMGARSGAGVGLDATTFNKIRNECRFEWPKNYVSMDRCERSRAAAKRGAQ